MDVKDIEYHPKPLAPPTVWRSPGKIKRKISRAPLKEKCRDTSHVIIQIKARTNLSAPITVPEKLGQDKEASVKESWQASFHFWWNGLEWSEQF